MIQVLSSPGLLIPVERIQLAHEYHLVQWLIQGVEELLSADITTDKPIRLDGLDAETAEKVVIKNAICDPQSVPQHDRTRLPVLPEGTPATFRYSEMACQGGGCSQRAFYPNGGKCVACGTVFSSVDTFTMTDWLQRSSLASYQVLMDVVICQNYGCRKRCISLKCPKRECGYSMGGNQLMPSCERELTSTHDFIHWAFMEELKQLSV